VAGLVTIALVFWIFGGRTVNATTVALVVVVGMLLTRVFTWDEVLKIRRRGIRSSARDAGHLADGLNRVGFVSWFAESVAGQLVGIPPIVR